MVKKAKAADKLLRQINGLKRKLRKSDSIISDNGKRNPELEERGKDFRRFLENTHDVIYQLDAKTRKYVYVSPSCLPVFGIPVKTFMKNPVFFLRTKVHRDDRVWLGKHVRDILTKKGKGKKNFRVEYRIVFKNDEAKWIVDRHTVFYGNDGKPETVIGSVRDVTFSKNTQEELTRSYNLQKEYLNLLLSIQNALPAPVALLDKDGNIISANHVWEKYAGDNPYFGPSPGTGMNYITSCRSLSGPHRSTGIELASGLRKLLKSGLPGYSKDYVVGKSGRQKWFRLLATSISKKRNEGAVVMHIDITETKEAEEAFKRSDKKYRMLFEENPLPLIVYDFMSLEILAVNKSAIEYYGYSGDEFLNMTTLQLRPKEHIEEYEKYRRGLIEKGIHNKPFNAGVWTHKKKNGEEVRVEIIRRAIEFEGKDAIIILINDVTEKNKAVEALERRSKEVSRLYEVEKQLSSTLDPSALYDKIYQIISELMSCDSLIISSFNREDKTIKCLSVWADNQKLDVSDFPLIPLAPEGHGIQSPVIRTGKPKIIFNYKNEFKKSKYQFTRSSNPDANVKSMMYSSGMMIPLKLEGDVIGTLQALSRKKRAYGNEELRILEAISSHISAATANALLYQQAQNEIAERIRSEEELKKNKENLENAQIVAHLGSWEMDSSNGKIFFSDELLRICGIGEAKSMSDFESAVNLFHPDERDDIQRAFEKLKKDGLPATSERRIVRPDGSVRYVRLHTGVVRGEDGAAAGYFGTVHDITEMKQINQELLKSLEEKELMLKEIHHRVKNNLQVVSSLLRMQSETVADKTAVEHLKISEQRVRSMALIHQQLYKTQDLSRINFREYVNELSMYLYHAYSLTGEKINLVVDVDEILFGIDTALPCGLIINELVTNSLKHAFPGGRDGRIEIRLYKNKGGKNVLIVKDNGVGMTEKKEEDKVSTLGMKLVNTLTEQLEARLEMKNEGGLEVKIMFSDLIYKHRI